MDARCKSTVNQSPRYDAEPWRAADRRKRKPLRKLKPRPERMPVQFIHSVFAKKWIFWAVSDSGSTWAPQAYRRGPSPLRSTAWSQQGAGNRRMVHHYRRRLNRKSASCYRADVCSFNAGIAQRQCVSLPYGRPIRKRASSQRENSCVRSAV